MSGHDFPHLPGGQRDGHRDRLENLPQRRGFRCPKKGIYQTFLPVVLGEPNLQEMSAWPKKWATRTLDGSKCSSSVCIVGNDRCRFSQGPQDTNGPQDLKVKPKDFWSTSKFWDTLWPVCGSNVYFLKINISRRDIMSPPRDEYYLSQVSKWKNTFYIQQKRGISIQTTKAYRKSKQPKWCIFCQTFNC